MRQEQFVELSDKAFPYCTYVYKFVWTEILQWFMKHSPILSSGS